jgi:hypothetical protein
MKLCVRCKVKKEDLEFRQLKTRLNSWCKDCCKEHRKEWYQKNRKLELDKAKAYHRATYADKRDHKIKKAVEWVKNNPEKYKVNAKKCYENNKSKVMAYAGMRRALKRNAVPIWIDSVKNSLNAIYAMRDWMNLTMFGIKYEVDHIIPLKNSRVCGLHVPNNLQVITQFDNRSKQNKFLEELNHG